MKRLSIIIILFSWSYFLSAPLEFSAQSYWFRTGQDAYLLLSGIGFNKTGGALLFNHPMNIATDGKRLLLADTRNNRILIWKKLPKKNVKPDLVLGQKNFIQNNPGTKKNQLNWPVGVFTAKGKVVVADTSNSRILIWNTFPKKSGQAADLSIEFDNPADPKERLDWPWDVWTDGTKLVVTNTGIGSTVLIYNNFPTLENQKADLYLKGKNPKDGSNRFGTPRTIGTDGKSYLVIGDHNAIGESNHMGNFFWNSFPKTDNKSYNFFMSNPNPKDQNQIMWGGIKTSSGKFINVASPGIAIWNSVPKSVKDPNLIVGRLGGPSDETGYHFIDGDGSDLTVTPSGKLFISLYNSNKVVVFNSLPTSSTQLPDFAIGAPDIDTNTLDTNYIITNGIPATNGSSLLVSSDKDGKLYAWKSIPSKSGTHPDTVYSFDIGPWDNALHNDIFVIAGVQMVQIWTNGLPLHGNSADLTFDKKIGSTSLQDIVGVALDDKYLYIADKEAKKLYVWKTLPDSNSSPAFSLDLLEAGRLSSDGNYLAISCTNNNMIQIYGVANLSSSSLPLAEISQVGNPPGHSRINLPQGVLIAENHLFIADTNSGRVFCWEKIIDAINGNFPEVILGQQDYSSKKPGIGIDRLFMPAGLAFHRNKLWVGEFKFSGRLVGFKYKAKGPFIELKPTFGDFGNVKVGSSVKMTFTVYNTGSKNLKIGSLKISQTTASEFKILNDRCSGKTISPSGKRKFSVKFTPKSQGAKEATLTINSNDSSAPRLTLPLYGKGTSKE